MFENGHASCSSTHRVGPAELKSRRRKRKHSNQVDIWECQSTGATTYNNPLILILKTLLLVLEPKQQYLKCNDWSFITSKLDRDNFGILTSPTLESGVCRESKQDKSSSADRHKFMSNAQTGIKVLTYIMISYSLQSQQRLLPAHLFNSTSTNKSVTVLHEACAIMMLGIIHVCWPVALANYFLIS
jgi:hypothetical protein